VRLTSRDCEEIDRMLTFRDWHRQSASDRVLYERTKRELVQRDWKYGQNYADAKSAIIDEILARARSAADELAAQQLSALARVSDLLEQVGIAHWLFGGWAVDFYAGSATRAHCDLDLAVWLEDLPRIAELLQDDGWRHAPFDDEDGGTGYEQGAVRLELTYLVRDSDGRVFTPLRNGQAAWPEETFADDVGELRGVRSRLLGLASLMHGKSSPRDDPEDAAKDRADFSRLSGLGT
jgi:Aminoglycoside-2''-adenylyltransferase/GrpB protein